MRGAVPIAESTATPAYTRTGEYQTAEDHRHAIARDYYRLGGRDSSPLSFGTIFAERPSKAFPEVGRPKIATTCRLLRTSWSRFPEASEDRQRWRRLDRVTTLFVTAEPVKRKARIFDSDALVWHDADLLLKRSRIRVACLRKIEGKWNIFVSGEITRAVRQSQRRQSKSPSKAHSRC